MPRPGVQNTRGRTTSANPIAAWRQRRADKKRDALEQAARMVTNQTADNENKMVDILSGIDFLHSALPKEELEHKHSEKQSCGDFEYAALTIQQLILKNPQTIKIDIRPLDEKLIALMLMFKEAIEQGDSHAARSARAALIRGIRDIRNRLPQVQTDLADLFVKQNTEYLDGWLTLVQTAKQVDMQERNLRQERALNDKKRDENTERMSVFTQEVGGTNPSNPEKALAFHKIAEHDLPEERVKWSDLERAVHREMIQFKLDQNVLNLEAIRLEQDEQIQMQTKHQLELLFESASKVPVVVDPDLLNKQNEQIEHMMRDMAAADQKIDEAIAKVDELNGRLAQLDTAPGTIRAMEAASNQAEGMVEKLRREQDIQAGAWKKELDEYRKRCGLRDEQEQKLYMEMVEEQELTQQAYVENYEVEDEVEREYIAAD